TERHGLGQQIEAVANPAAVQECESAPLGDRRPARQHHHDAALAMVEAQDDPARPLVRLIDERYPPVGHRPDLAPTPRVLSMVICNALIRKEFYTIRWNCMATRARGTRARHIRFISLLARVGQDVMRSNSQGGSGHGLWHFCHKQRKNLSQSASFVD